MANGMSTVQNRVGDGGEALVCDHLRQQGWQIVAQQWRCRWGELDVVARQGATLVFVEVKTRGQRSWDESGRMAITHRKQQKLIRTAMAFLGHFPTLADLDCRFDVALVRHHAAAGATPSSFVLLDYIPSAFDIR